MNKMNSSQKSNKNSHNVSAPGGGGIAGGVAAVGFPSPHHAMPRPPSNKQAVYMHQTSVKTDYSVGDEFSE